MNCKPCITIRTFFVLLKKHYLAFRKDLKEYSLVNYYACEMPEYKKTPLDLDGAMKQLKEIRESAKFHYSKEEEDAILKSINETQNDVKSATK